MKIIVWKVWRLILIINKSIKKLLQYPKNLSQRMRERVNNSFGAPVTFTVQCPRERGNNGLFITLVPKVL